MPFYQTQLLIAGTAVNNISDTVFIDNVAYGLFLCVDFNGSKRSHYGKLHKTLNGTSKWRFAFLESFMDEEW